MKQIVALAATALGCDMLGLGGPSRRTLIVQHHAAECVGVFIQRCLLIKEPGQADFDFSYTGIEGFEYQWGFVYELAVEEHHVSNPPADARGRTSSSSATRSRARERTSPRR